MSRKTVGMFLFISEDAYKWYEEKAHRKMCTAVEYLEAFLQATFDCALLDEKRKNDF